MNNDQNSILNKIKQSFKHLFTGQFIFTIAGFIGAYFFARFLGPEKYGTWQTANIFTGYAILFSLGLPFVMRRDFIQLRTENKTDEANKIANQVFSYNLVVNPIFSVILFVVAVFFTKDKDFSLALITVGFINIFQIISGYGDIITKAFNQYDKLKNAKIILSVFTLISVFFVWKYRFNGLLFGFLLAQAAYALYFYIKRPLKFKWYWNNKLLKSLIFIGFPIYLQTVVNIVFSSIDRLIIAANLSFEEVGHYSLSTLIKTPVTLLVSTLSIVVFTELNEKYGKKDTPDVIKLHMNVPQQFVTYILSPLIVFGVLLLPWFTKTFLPDYVPGIEAAQVFVFAILFLSLAGFSSNALFILNKQKLAAVSFTLAGILKVAGSLIVLKLGYGITGVASVTLIAYLLYDTLMVFWVNKQIKESFNFSVIIKRNVPVLLSVLTLLITIVVISTLNLDKLSLKATLVKTGLWIILTLPYALYTKNKIKKLLSVI